MDLMGRMHIDTGKYARNQVYKYHRRNTCLLKDQTISINPVVKVTPRLTSLDIRSNSLGVSVLALDPSQTGEVSPLAGVDEGVLGGLQGLGGGRQVTVGAPDPAPPTQHGQVPVGDLRSVRGGQRLARRVHRPDGQRGRWLGVNGTAERVRG